MAGYDLAPTGSPIFAPAIFGNGYFSTGGQLVNTSPFGNGATTWTVEFWAQVTNSGGSCSWFSTGAGTASASRVNIGISSTNYLTLSVGTYTANAIGAAPQTQGWHHYALGWLSGRYRLYVDGVQVSTVAGLSANVLTWAGGFGISSQVSGGIDEVRISNSNRYPSGTAFAPAGSAYTVDGTTLALYHLEADGTDGDTAGGGGPTVWTADGTASIGVVASGTATTDRVASGATAAALAATGSTTATVTVTGAGAAAVAAAGASTAVTLTGGGSGATVRSAGSVQLSAAVTGADAITVTAPPVSVADAVLASGTAHIGVAATGTTSSATEIAVTGTTAAAVRASGTASTVGTVTGTGRATVTAVAVARLDAVAAGIDGVAVGGGTLTASGSVTLDTVTGGSLRADVAATADTVTDLVADGSAGVTVTTGGGYGMDWRDIVFTLAGPVTGRAITASVAGRTLTTGSLTGRTLTAKAST